MSSTSSATMINEKEWLLAEELSTASCLPMAMRAALELDVLQIIANVGDDIQISPAQIVDQIPNVTNPDAAITLDRILRVLASHSVLKCCATLGNNGKPERLYGLTPLCKYFVKNNDGLSFAPLALVNQDKLFTDPWFYLKDAILEGSQPFFKAHGVQAFEYPARDQTFNVMFNRAMSEYSAMIMVNILDIYQGFKDSEELVDVGGTVGSTLKLILFKYPHIKGANFDLFHIVKDALEYTGLTHLGGDMFESVSSSKAILLKWILYDWSDDHCIRLLKNCHKALSKNGKLVIVDRILPIDVETTPFARKLFHVDLIMLGCNQGGKERTMEEFENLAKATKFVGDIKLICCVNGLSIIELYK